MIELKPCPFCGGTASFDVRPERLGIAIKHNSGCVINGFTGCIFGMYQFNIIEYPDILENHKERLAERWNRRVNDDEHDT